MSKLFKIHHDLIANSGRKFIILVAILSAATLLAVYIYDALFLTKPCYLCLIQRVPYFLLMIISLIVLLLGRFFRVCLILIAVIYFMGGSIAIYHTGVEYGLFQMTKECNFDDDPALSPEQLKELIMNKKSGGCNQPTLIFSNFNLSFAELNVILSVLMLLFTIFILRRVNEVTR